MSVSPATSRLDPRHLHVWLGLMTVTGFCSMIYELALAQLLTGLLGGAMLRFATTLGVYIVGMGLGSISFHAKDDERDGKLFFAAETVLFLLGLTAPLLFVGAYRISFLLTADPSTQVTLVLWLTHLVIFATGFCSGLELPILSAIAGRRSHGGDSKVLAADYVGMFVASLLFPFVLYPYVGLISAFGLATLLNLIAAASTYVFIGGRSRAVFSAIAIFLVINVAALACEARLQDWLSRIYSSLS
jgi:spermidine synthase